MNTTEKKAEEIIRMAYNKGGLISSEEMTKEQQDSTEDKAVNYVMCFYGAFSNAGKIGYYGLNEKGFELGRRGFFSGEEKEIRSRRTGMRVAIITSITSIIIAIIALIK